MDNNLILKQICLGMRSLLKHNGPAIKGGCVTWRSHPATGPGTLAGELSRWQVRYGVFFAVRLRILLRAGAIAVKV